MEVFQFFLAGLYNVCQPQNLLYLTAGAFLGTIIGALPGMGAASGTAILLPLTFGMSPISSLVMLCGVYYGTQFGGSITAILLNVPGTSSAAVTAIDGYPMALRGEAGKALGMAQVSSFAGGQISTVLLAVMGMSLARFALRFGPPEYFALTLMGLLLISGLTGKYPLKGYLMMALGLFIGIIGIDLVTGTSRFTMGSVHLLDGVALVPVLVGLFGFSEIIGNIEKMNQNTSTDMNTRLGLRQLLPRRAEWAASIPAMVRGTLVGFFVGVMPGAGAAIASALSYGIEKKVSRNKDQLGQGAIEGVAVSEASNNASVGGAMVSMLALGIPGSPATAILLTALVMFGIQPGPTLFTKEPVIVWSLIASMLIGNVILLLLNILCIPVFLKILKAANRIINPIVIVLCLIGAFSIKNSMFDVWIMIFAGIAGYFLKKYHFPMLPLILAMILGAKLEESLRQSLLLSAYDWSIFITRPISCGMLIICILGVIYPMIKTKFQK